MSTTPDSFGVMRLFRRRIFCCFTLCSIGLVFFFCKLNYRRNVSFEYFSDSVQSIWRPSSHEWPTPLLPSVYTDDTFVMSNLPPLDVIPRIIHFMWMTDRLPSAGADHLRLWHRFHPEWRLVLWTDHKLAALIDRLHGRGRLSRLYKSFPENIMRVDFARYIILYTFGGVYADIDVKPLGSLEPVLSHHSCVVAREPEPYAVSVKRDSALLGSNFLMASRPGHPIWALLIDQLRSRKGPHAFTRVGPAAVTDALAEYAASHPYVHRQAAVFLAPSLYFDPPVNSKGDKDHFRLLDFSCSLFKKSKRVSAYVRHVCQVFAKERRIDWRAMYRQKRHFNESFTRHFMYSVYYHGVKFRSYTHLTGKLREIVREPEELIELVRSAPNSFDEDQALIRANHSAG